MKKQVIWIVGWVAAVALFIGAYFLYGKLSKEYKPEGQLIVEDNQGSNNQDNNGSNQGSNNQDNNGSNQESNKQENNEIKDFTMLDSTGKEVKLSDYFGKTIVLNFWASWCPPCKEEMPYFEEAFKENADNENIQFIMVNMTAGDDIDDAIKVIEDNGYTFPVFYDYKGEAAYAYGVSSLPATYFLDEDGNVVTHAVGALTKELLDEGIGILTK